MGCDDNVGFFFPASLAKRFLGQNWVTASGEKERGIKFNEALHTVLKWVCLSEMAILVQEKLDCKMDEKQT